MVIEGVADVQHPPLTRIHGDCGVPAAMSGKADHHDTCCKVGQFLRSGKPAPRFALRGVVFDDCGLVCALSWPIPRSLHQRVRALNRKSFPACDVDTGPREVGEATSVVGIEVCEHDVTNVFGFETEIPNVVDRRLIPVEGRPEVVTGGSETGRGLFGVAQA